VHITEISSTMGWRDKAGKAYTFAFLDYAINQEINIGAKDV